MSRPHPSDLPDLHAEITAQIIRSLELGVRPWTRPWSSSPALRPIRHNGQPYHGINVLLLWLQTHRKGYTPSVWMTSRPAQALGGAVRRGEAGTHIVFAKPLAADANEAETALETAEKADGRRLVLRRYCVFNLAQIDGLDTRYPTFAPCDRPRTTPPVATPVDTLAAAAHARVVHGGDVACFDPGRDLIRMPYHASFQDSEGHDAVLAHELIHWTGHAARLARDLTGRFGSPAYAREELVAEVGAAILCADLGICDQPRHDHAAYIAAWLKALKDDKRLIFAAAAQAEKAVAYLHAHPSP